MNAYLLTRTKSIPKLIGDMHCINHTIPSLLVHSNIMFFLGLEKNLGGQFFAVNKFLCLDKKHKTHGPLFHDLVYSFILSYTLFLAHKEYFSRNLSMSSSVFLRCLHSIDLCCCKPQANLPFVNKKTWYTFLIISFTSEFLLCSSTLVHSFDRQFPHLILTFTSKI